MIRKLDKKDAFKMFEWMQDNNITKYFDKDFSKYSVNDCKNFIHNSIVNYNLSNPKNLNFAVTDKSNDYKGTVTLKHINYKTKCAEFAIILIKEVHGSGLAKIAFNEIMQYGFKKLDLNFIYFSCKKDNVIANKFYSKNNAKLIDINILIKKGVVVKGYNISLSTFNWYIIYK